MFVGSIFHKSWYFTLYTTLFRFPKEVNYKERTELA